MVFPPKVDSEGCQRAAQSAYYADAGCDRRITKHGWEKLWFRIFPTPPKAFRTTAKHHRLAVASPG